MATSRKWYITEVVYFLKIDFLFTFRNFVSWEILFN